MKFFLLRILPLLIGALALLVSYAQWLSPLSYPWPLVFYFVAVALATFALCERRLTWTDGLEKTLPFFLTTAAFIFGFLTIETPIERLILSLLLAGTTYYFLELLFFLTRAPSRYPVNGLSRFSIALVPLAGYYLASTMQGLLVFLHLPWAAVLPMFVLIGGVFFYCTSHPAANLHHRSRWTIFGGFIGLHLGLLQLFLPVGLAVHGALAALFFFFPLRLRRYAFAPAPSFKIAWTETALAVLCFATLLGTARWT